MKEDALGKGAFATKNLGQLNAQYLDEKVNSLTMDPYTKLPRPEFPEIKKGRYEKGFKDII